MQSQCCCRKSAAAEVQLRIDALQLLAHFLSLPGQQLSRLSEAVSELVIDVFPASSWEWKRGSTQSTDYARQLMALMDSVVAAAEIGCPVQAMLQVRKEQKRLHLLLFNEKPSILGCPDAGKLGGVLAVYVSQQTILGRPWFHGLCGDCC